MRLKRVGVVSLVMYILQKQGKEQAGLLLCQEVDSTLNIELRYTGLFCSTSECILFLGSRVGAVVRVLASHQCGPGSILARCHTTVCGLNLRLVLALLRGFFTGLSGFPPTIKTNISKFQFNQDREPWWKPAAKADAASSLNIVKY